MPAITPGLIAIVAAAGSIAGCLGALLGIGGGVFLVPFLNVVLGLPWPIASGISLMTIMATSSAVTSDATGRRHMNLRLAILLLAAASPGALVGGISVVQLSERTLGLIFAVVTALIAVIMLSRLDRRNVILDTAVDPGLLGGRFHDEDSGQEIVYRLKRLPLATAISVAGGYISGILGIGGGILQVPALNSWCGVPIRAATATSAVMIGVTAAASAPIYYGRGHVNGPLAAAAVVGVLVGSRAGLWIVTHARVKWLKVLMALVLIAVSITYFRRAL